MTLRSKFRVLETIDDEIAPIQDFSVVTSSLGDLFVRYTNEAQEVRA
jgi:ABC-2 type transport system ATP-binding protein